MPHVFLQTCRVMFTSGQGRLCRNLRRRCFPVGWGVSAFVNLYKNGALFSTFRQIEQNERSVSAVPAAGVSRLLRFSLSYKGFSGVARLWRLHLRREAALLPGVPPAPPRLRRTRRGAPDGLRCRRGVPVPGVVGFTLPPVKVFRPHPPSPLPRWGRGSFLVFLCKGLRPLHPQACTGRLAG